MKKSLLLAVALAGLLVLTARAQDGKPSLEAAATALGASDLRSVQFSGWGSDYIFGQAYDGNSPWPRFNLPSFTMTIDYITPSLRDDRRRAQAENPPLGGGFQPLAGEQRQIWMLSGSYAWDVIGDNPVTPAAERDQRTAVDGRMAQIWLTPHGFIKAAMSSKAAVKAESVRGGTRTVISFTTPSGVRLEGILNRQNLVERIETWFDNPVLGDMMFEAVFSDYKDFGGVRFPTHILQRSGGYPVLDVTITDVKPNAAATFEVPAIIRQATPPGPQVIQPEKLSDGIWIIPGAAKSVAVEFRDHIVVVDAPETEARSVAVMDAIKRIIPGKPIRYVVNTHTHFDHAGGLRTYAAEGATIITQAQNVPYYEQVWMNPRTINPDRLARSGRKPVFEGLVGNRTLADGSRELVIYHYAGNMHNAGMLMVFLPREKILIEADSFTPAGTPNDPPGGLSNLVQFYDVVERLRLDVEQIVPIHGRVTTLGEAHEVIERYKQTQFWTK